MANRLDEASALIQHAKRTLTGLKPDYEGSLHNKQIRVELQIAIKVVLESLRSALEYLAYDLCERFGIRSDKAKVYFPIAAKGAKQSDFKALVARNIPGLPEKRRDLVTVLESFQAFASGGCEWLPDFATLTNENKHRNLTPQTRSEQRELRLQSDGASVRIPEGARVDIGNGATIQIGGMVVPGGQTLSPGSPPQAFGEGKVENVVWVCFSFEATGEHVLPFLDKCINGTDRILKEIEAHI